jgi:replication factor C small subunit
MPTLAEKWNPTQISEINWPNPRIEKKAKAIAERKRRGNILLFGQPGFGKTETLNVIRKTILSNIKEGWQGEVILGPNDTGTRAIDKIEATIQNMGEYVVQIDELDNMSADFQDRLRNLMDRAKSNAVFLFSTNSVNKIIDPVRNRCVECHWFLSQKQMLMFAELVNKKDALGISDTNLQGIVQKWGYSYRTLLEEMEDA